MWSWITYLHWRNCTDVIKVDTQALHLRAGTFGWRFFKNRLYSISLYDVFPTLPTSSYFILPRPSPTRGQSMRTLPLGSKPPCFVRSTCHFPNSFAALKNTRINMLRKKTWPGLIPKVALVARNTTSSTDTAETYSTLFLIVCAASPSDIEVERHFIKVE